MRPPPDDPGERLDAALARRGLLPSRARAAEAIRAGLVRVDGAVVTRPAFVVGPGVVLAVDADPVGYVGRGGLKLQAALDAFGIDPSGLACLDVGASTGGFTQCLLRRGARRVIAVDVGRAQLHPTLRADARVLSLEQTDVRELERLPEPVDLAVVDVSFISLRLVLPHVARLAGPGVAVVALLKPQFELGPAGRSRRGVVRSLEAPRQALDGLLRRAREQGWGGGAWVESPVAGREGNREFLVHLITPAA